MTANRKIVQLSLITIGTFLILSTYFFYPTIKENKFFEEDAVKDETVKTDDGVSNIFENVTYKGENAGNPFTVYADRAEIKENANIIHMKKMIIKIFLRDSKWVIECAIGIYNKSNYNKFLEEAKKLNMWSIVRNYTSWRESFNNNENILNIINKAIKNAYTKTT